MFEDYSIRKASVEDVEMIWKILYQAIQKRSKEGSQQWQDGYPNLEVVSNDIKNGYRYVCTDNQEKIVAYVALIFDIEPAYEIIEGKWLSNMPYAVIHRLAVSQERKIKGLATWIMSETENICKEKSMYSIKVDTNFDNTGMLRIFDKLGYSYCGEVYFRGSARKAFEKLLT